MLEGKIKYGYRPGQPPCANPACKRGMKRGADAPEEKPPADEAAGADAEATADQTELEYGLDMIKDLDEFTKDRFTELTDWFDEQPEDPERMAVQALVVALNGNPDWHVASAAVYGATVAAGIKMRLKGPDSAQ